MPFDLRPHQEAAIAKMHDGCILCGGVGVGKSHTAVGYYLQHHAPKTVYVITTAKKRDKHDWQMLFGDVGMTSNPEVTPGSLVYVDSWENIKKYEEVTDAFFIFDEQRLVGSGRWVKAFYKIAAANRWIMLSATPGDNWLDYVPVFRANGFIKNLTQFKEDHVIARWTGRYYQIQGYRQVGRLVRWRNQLLVDMPYEKHTTRHTHEVAVEYDKDLVRELVNKRWHVYEKRPLTDASELFRVMRRVVYTDASRLEAVRTLLKEHPKLIVFYSFNYELEMLRTLNIPPTQIMKMPDGIVQLGPSRTSSSSASALTPSPVRTEESSTSDQRSASLSTSTSTSSSSQRSDPTRSTGQETLWTTGSDSPRLTTDPKDSDDWTYALSMMHQDSSTQAPCPSQTSSDDSESEWNNSISATTEPSLSSITSGGEQQIQDRWGNTHSLTPTSLRTQTEDSRTSPTESSSTTDSRPLIGSGGSGKPSEQTRETECQTAHDPTQTKNSSTTTTERESRSSGTPTSGTSDASATSPSEASPKTSTTKRSSAPSKRSQDLSGPGSASTSSPQFQVAEWNGHKHEGVPTTTSWVYLVQYVAGAEAWECIETDAMCFFSMPYSYKLWWQAYGRIDRLNTPFNDLHYYVLYGGSIIEKAVGKSLETKKSFNESAFAAEIGW